MCRLRGLGAGALAVVLVSGCSSVPVPSATELQGSNNAFLKGMESSGFSLGSTFDVKIKSVDGKSTWTSMTGYSAGLAVPAGQHHLVALCSMVAEMGNVRTQPVDTDLDVNLVSGHTYQLQPGGNPKGSGCKVTIVDVADQPKTGS